MESETLAVQIRRAAAGIPGVRVLGPAPAPIEFLRGRHRWRIMIRAEKYRDLRKTLGPARSYRPRRGLRLAIDVDPVDLM